MSNPYIIAEVGSNWSTLDDCLRSIGIAKSCGADAVKFQLFDQESLYGFYGRRDEMPSALADWWLPELKEKADSVGIDFMCSAFSPELIDAVDPFVKAHKVASAEMCHVRMLERLKEIGKPVFLSMGSHSFEEIGQALKILGDTPVTVMYCKAAYPAKYSDTAMIEAIRCRLQVPVGFSDHTIDVIESPFSALKHGAVAIEKHANFVGSCGPDSPHSLNQEEFNDMVDILCGGPCYFNTPDERAMITTHNRRLIAIKNIVAGDEFIEGKNFGIYRALKETEAASPFDIDKFKGKVANQHIIAGEGVNLQHIMTE